MNSATGNKKRQGIQRMLLRFITREKVIFFFLLALVIGIVAYAPIRYGFVYPTGGDDTAFHVMYLEDITQDFGQIKKLSYYGVVLLAPFTYLGIPPLTVFSVFNYVVIVAMFVSLWFLTRRFYGLIGAILSFYITIFMVKGTWYYFEDGTIFNIFNLWVVGVLAIYGLCSWLNTGRYKWLIMSGLLFVISSLVHSTTYLYILAAMLLFIPGFAAFSFIKNDRIMFKRVFSFGAVFAISILTAGVTWLPRLFIAMGKPMVSSITNNEPSFASPSDFSYWVMQYLDPGTEILLAIAAVTLLIMLLKGKPDENRVVISKLNQPLSYIILAFVIVLSVGAFTKLGYNSERFSRDLAMIVGLSTAVLLGIILTNYRYKFNYLIISVLLGAMVFSNTPLHKWLGDYSALRPCDIQTINFLNSLSESQTEVQVSPQVASWIYSLYTRNEIKYTRISALNDYQEADYILYRNNGMTYSSRTYAPKDYRPTVLAVTDSLIRVAEFESDGDRVTIYRVNKTVTGNHSPP